jgi:hypothetical protein
LLLALENSRSPDLVDGRVVPVPLLVESLLGPPRVFGRPAAPLAGFAFLVVAGVAAADFLGDESGRLLGCEAGPVLFVLASALPVLPLLARVFGYVMASSALGLASRFLGRRVSRARCSLGSGTELTLGTGILDELLVDTECPSPSSKISSGRLRSGSTDLVSIEVAIEFFLDLGTVCSEPPMDLAEPLSLSWLWSRLGRFWLFDLVPSLWRGKKIPAAWSSSLSILASLSR